MTKAQRQRLARARRTANRTGRRRNLVNRMLRRFHLPDLPDTPPATQWKQWGMGVDPGNSHDSQTVYYFLTHEPTRSHP